MNNQTTTQTVNPTSSVLSDISTENRQSSSRRSTFVAGIAMGLGLAATGAGGYWLGCLSSGSKLEDGSVSQQLGSDPYALNGATLEKLQASASHGGENMAIATGMVGDDSEGFFALDFISGNLQGIVINPRRGGVTGQYAFNVMGALGGPSKNPQYLMVTGNARLSASSNSTILYVVNVNTGMYTALGVPWDKSMEASGGTQGGVLTVLTSGQLREPIGLGRKPMTPPAVDNKKPANPRPGAANAKPPAGAKADEENLEDAFGVPPGNNPNAQGNPNAPGNPRKQR